MSYSDISTLQAHAFSRSRSDTKCLPPKYEPAVRIYPASGKSRPQSLKLIQNQFEQQFGANLADDNLPIYRGIDRSGSPIAAFAVNKSPNHFFVRHYIGDVVNNLQGTFGPDVNKDNIIELNHLSASKTDVLKDIAPAIAERFYAEGFRYLICTATHGLRSFFARKHLAPAILGAARENQIPQSQQGRWGCYYEQKPMVIAGDLVVALRRFRAPQKVNRY